MSIHVTIAIEEFCSGRPTQATKNTAKKTLKRFEEFLLSNQITQVDMITKKDIENFLSGLQNSTNKCNSDKYSRKVSTYKTFIDYLNATGTTLTTSVDHDVIRKFILHRKKIDLPAYYHHRPYKAQELFGEFIFSAKNHGYEDVTKISKSFISSYLEKKYNKPLSPGYIQDIQRLVSTFFNWLVSEEYIGKKPKFPKPVKNKRVVKWLSEQEEYLLFKQKMSQRDELIILFGFEIALRLQETTDLTWGDIDFPRRTITVQKGKNNKQRVIAFHPAFTKVLRKYQASVLGDITKFPPKSLNALPVFSNGISIETKLEKKWNRISL